MTEQQATGTASSQLKDLMMQRLNQGLGLAAKAAGQQAGTVAQAVWQTGEEMRQQEQDGQGKMPTGSPNRSSGSAGISARPTPMSAVTSRG